MLKKFLILLGFSIAMAFVEAAVVVYLRQLYYPEGFAFPLRQIPQNILTVELGREFSTIVMLATVGAMAGSNLVERFSYFLFCFGVWDIFYYIWLKLMLDWPESLLTWDILFLIPVPWVGPVLAPILVALTMAVIGIVAIYRIGKGAILRVSKFDWLLGFVAALSIFISFVWDFPRMINQELPSPYHWEFLMLGEFMILGAFFHVLKHSKAVSAMS